MPDLSSLIPWIVTSFVVVVGGWFVLKTQVANLIKTLGEFKTELKQDLDSLRADIRKLSDTDTKHSGDLAVLTYRVDRLEKQDDKDSSS